MFDVIMYDGGVYRSDELYEMIEDVGGVVLLKNRNAQMLTVIMSIPHGDRKMVEGLCLEIGGKVKEVPLAGTEIAVVGPTLGRHHMPHPICDIAEYLRRCGAVTVVMGLARGRGKLTAQINLKERKIIDEYDVCVFMLGNFKSCVEAKAELFEDIEAPVVLVSGPKPEGVEDLVDANVYDVGRKMSRMKTSIEIAKLVEIGDRVIDVLRDKMASLEEDPLYTVPSDLKAVLETYGPINMSLRPVPLVMHLDGLRAKVSYDKYHEDIENMEIEGRRIGDICTVSPSKIDDNSTLIRILTRSEVEYRDSRNKRV